MAPPCTHKTLVLMKEAGAKLRCRTCHLVIRADELDGGCCPECYELRRERCRDFEPVSREQDGVTRYRCEGCGAIVECKD